MANRREGQTGQIGYQGRSHAPIADCGTYRLVRKVAPSEWLVEWTAACCTQDEPRQSVIRFVSKERYDRHF